MSAPILHLPSALSAHILNAALRAFPRECCGLIEGTHGPEGWRALAAHEAANLAPAPERHFLVDPDVQFRVLRALRGSGRTVIGCYHSHPGGTPVPSETDRTSAVESDFLWLIAAGDPVAGFRLGAFVFATPGNVFLPVTLAP